MNAIVNSTTCPLMRHPSMECEMVDEALFGWPVTILENSRDGWCLVRTHYRYTGYAPASCLLPGNSNAARWADLTRQVVRKGVCTVLAAPFVQSWPMATLTRGALVASRGEPDEKGWVKVSLPDGREGYTKISFLGKYYEKPAFDSEQALRAALASTAAEYLGTHYRWGGKSPLGIDCSGLAFMAYFLNGVIIYRDAAIKEGFPLREISRNDLKPGDLIFFPGHVAVYEGKGSFIHSTGFAGSDGVVRNSLNPAAPDYRADLDRSVTGVGSIF
ncbi:MAG: C40 family peptidase [Intestinimonas sp.]|jgi:hypothetical protein|nr:C40 family peptidase [Intestinimonas sp.]